MNVGSTGFFLVVRFKIGYGSREFNFSGEIAHGEK